MPLPVFTPSDKQLPENLLIFGQLSFFYIKQLSVDKKGNTWYTADRGSKHLC